jgi:hypothetical protein
MAKQMEWDAEIEEKSSHRQHRLIGHHRASIICYKLRHETMTCYKSLCK